MKNFVYSIEVKHKDGYENELLFLRKKDAKRYEAWYKKHWVEENDEVTIKLRKNVVFKFKDGYLR